MHLFKQYEKDNIVQIEIFKKIQKIQTGTDMKDLVSFHFERNPIENENILYLFKIFLQEIKFLYYPVNMKRIISFFYVEENLNYL